MFLMNNYVIQIVM